MLHCTSICSVIKVKDSREVVTNRKACNLWTVIDNVNPQRSVQLSGSPNPTTLSPENMAQYILRAITLCFFFVPTVSYSLQLPGNRDFIANYSHSSLSSVPKNLPPQTTILDLQQNSISVLLISDFSSLSKLKVLNMSYNLLRELDSSILRFNGELAYLDLSHNRLANISGRFNTSLQHLDLSFNEFQSLSMCAEFGSIMNLQYLGLGAAKVLRSDLMTLASLELHTVFLELSELSDYEPGSLQMLNTQKLHLFFPTKTTDPYVVLSDAVRTSKTVELSNIYYFMTPRPLSEIFKNSRVSDITLNKVAMPWSMLIMFFQAVWSSSIEFLTVNEVVIIGDIKRQQFNYSRPSVQRVTVQNVKITDYIFSQDDVYVFFADMDIEHLTLSHANILYMLCPSEPSKFRDLDFSNNAMTDDIFQECRNLTMLETLILQGNKLRLLSKVSSMASHMASLTHLDVSHNSLQYRVEEECHWPERIITLDLAANDLTESVFRCLPLTVKNLDLHNNQIDYISMGIEQLTALEELNLASNRLKDLPDCSPFRGLTVLNVAINSILTPSSHSLHSCQSVKTIHADNNPFQCDCDIRDFIYREKQSSERLTKWPESYQCNYPETFKGTLLKDFQISEISCNTTLLIVLIFIIVGVLTLSLFCLCKYMDIPWYIKMMWQWTQTRRRARIRGKTPQSLQQNFTFHAFISYSELDSSWVKECLLPNLEREDGSIQICQHERNFIPGRSIVENIINCIEKSYKSIFVLSPNFIQSEWCHYELYFAHHKLFTENSDDLILILLEPIPKYLIPARYHKLKALMAQRTYLEWPKERGKHRLFWANLRAAISINLHGPGEELIT